jgi:hypothetical protein
MTIITGHKDEILSCGFNVVFTWSFAEFTKVNNSLRLNYWQRLLSAGNFGQQFLRIKAPLPKFGASLSPLQIFNPTGGSEKLIETLWETRGLE